jgi:hypothetical protein
VAGHTVPEVEAVKFLSKDVRWKLMVQIAILSVVVVFLVLQSLYGLFMMLVAVPFVAYVVYAVVTLGRSDKRNNYICSMMYDVGFAVLLMGWAFNGTVLDMGDAFLMVIALLLLFVFFPMSLGQYMKHRRMSRWPGNAL